MNAQMAQDRALVEALREAVTVLDESVYRDVVATVMERAADALARRLTDLAQARSDVVGLKKLVEFRHDWREVRPDVWESADGTMQMWILRLPPAAPTRETEAQR